MLLLRSMGSRKASISQNAIRTVHMFLPPYKFDPACSFFRFRMLGYYEVVTALVGSVVHPGDLALVKESHQAMDIQQEPRELEDVVPKFPANQSYLASHVILR